MKQTRWHRFREKLSVMIARKPDKVVLGAIMLFNLVFFFLSAVVISHLAPESLAHRGFWDSVFYTITMILDAGCIQFVIEDIGKASVGVVIACIAVVVIGMITFTGAVIGYLTNYISDFISRAATGERRLHISGHTVILNWNSLGAEIVNDLLYSEEAEKIVILSARERTAIEKELSARIADTLNRERAAAEGACAGMDRLARSQYLRKNRLKNRLQIVIREGATFETKQLEDISLKDAKTVLILEDSPDRDEPGSERRKDTDGNAGTVKTLMQVAEITGADASADRQKIIVEVDDAWTLSLVKQVIGHKERSGKCTIVPVPVHQLLGQILSQFSIMPDLNAACDELFSYKGAAFFSCPAPEGTDDELVRRFLGAHCRAIPLSTKDTREGRRFFYMAEHERDRAGTESPSPDLPPLEVEDHFWLERRNILLLGHNSESGAVMDGFEAFRSEWNRDGQSDILDLRVVDDGESLEKLDFYRAYPYVTNVTAAGLYDQDAIYRAVEQALDAFGGKLSVLILSDDAAARGDLDTAALTYLIYLQDIFKRYKAAHPGFDPADADVVMQILNPQNYDVARSYGVTRAVISDRYLSKMITQVGEKDSLYEFYHDILTYDAAGVTAYESKELYIKKVRRFFKVLPPPCTADQLIRAVYAATPNHNKALVLGYVDDGGATHLFSGDQREIRVALTPRDKLILYSNH